MDARWLIPVGVLVAAVGLSFSHKLKSNVNSYENPNLLQLGMQTPTIWIYYDDTDVNSRLWTDFGARSSRVLNLPFLNLCYETIANATQGKYHIEVISGLPDAAQRLGGWDKLPFVMQNRRLPLRTEELTYLKIAFLKNFGGLWIHPASIVLQPFPELPTDKLVYFGSDPLETYAGPKGTALPNLHAIWSGKPNHPVLVTWEKMLFERLDRGSGGKEVRHDYNWDIIYASTKSVDVVVMPQAELTRKPSGRKIELDDLMAAGTGGDLPFDVPPETVYVPFPWPEMLERRLFGWFLRMSEEQIMSSDLAVTHLFRAAGL